MVVPSLIAIIAPIFTGLVFGVPGVLGLLIGGLSSGFVLLIFMANAGGAWDNAKEICGRRAISEEKEVRFIRQRWWAIRLSVMAGLTVAWEPLSKPVLLFPLIEDRYQSSEVASSLTPGGESNSTAL